MAVKDASISLQTLGGTWEFVGTDRARGVYAENLQVTSDRWGSLSGSFDLRRNPRSQFPDIGAFSPCDIEISGVKVWSGRVKGTPSRDGSDQSMNVQLEGWQAHLDDDVYVPAYVHTSLTDWKDQRSDLRAGLGTTGGKLSAGWQVQAGAASLVLTKPNGFNPGAWTAAAVMLDLGSNTAWRKIVYTYDCSAWTGTSTLTIQRSSDAVNWIVEAATSLTGALTANVLAWDVGAGDESRYIRIYVDSNGTPTTDEWVRVSAAKVFMSNAYESGNLSILKADDVVRDALTKSTLLLSSDRSQVDPANAVTFSIPSLATQDYKTPREVISGINAYHNYVTKVDAEKRMVFKALPAAPEIEVGEWSPIEFEDASQGSGEDIYNRVIVEYTSATGDAMKTQRTSAQLPGSSLVPVTTPVFDNPSFATNATGWTVAGPVGSTGTIVRTTTGGEFDSSPGGGKFTMSAGDGAVGQMTGTWTGGLSYVITCRLKASVAGPYRVFMDVGNTHTDTHISLTTSFQTFNFALTTTTDEVNGHWQIGYDGGGSTDTVYLDTFQILASLTVTLIDRRNFRRTKLLQVSSALPDDGIAAAQIGDVYLTGHKTTPFKGQVAVTGPVREILTGRSIPPEQLLLRTTELIRLGHLIDPDTGAVGRDGRIAQATYDWAKDQASLSLDSTSGNFESLLARLGALSSSG